MPDYKKVLEEYVATANSGNYKSLEEVNSKFPELKEFDSSVLEEYVATANSGNYKSLEEVNSKFPELFIETKDTEQTPKGVQATGKSSEFQFPFTSGDSSLGSPEASEANSVDINLSQDSISLYEKFKEGVGGSITLEQESNILSELETTFNNRSKSRSLSTKERQESKSFEDYKSTDKFKEKYNSLIESEKKKNRIEFLSNLSDEDRLELTNYVDNNYSKLKEEDKEIIAETKIQEGFLKTYIDKYKDLDKENVEGYTPEFLNQVKEDTQKYLTIVEEYENNLIDLDKNREEEMSFEEELSHLKRTNSKIADFTYRLGSSILDTVDNIAEAADRLRNPENFGIDYVKEEDVSKIDFDLKPSIKWLEDHKQEDIDFQSIETPLELFAWGKNTLVSQVGNILLTATGSPELAFLNMGMSEAGSKIKELKAANEAGANYSEQDINQAALFSGLKGGTIGVVERGILSRAGKALKSAPKGSLKPSIIEGITDSGIGMASEVSDVVLDNIFHKTVLGDKDRHILDGVNEAVVASLFMDGVIQGTSRSAPLLIHETSKAVRSIKDKKEFNSNVKKAQGLIEELKNVPEDSSIKKDLQKKIKEIVGRNKEIIKKDLDVLTNLSSDNIKNIVESDKKLKKYFEQKREVESAEFLTEETRESLNSDITNKITEVHKRKEEIFNSPDQDITLRSKAIQNVIKQKNLEGEEKPSVSAKEITREYKDLLKQEDYKNKEKRFDNILKETNKIAKETGKPEVSLQQGLELLQKEGFYQRSDVDQKKQLTSLFKNSFNRDNDIQIKKSDPDSFWSKVEEDYIDSYAQAKNTFEGIGTKEGRDISKRLKLIAPSLGSKLDIFDGKIFKEVESFSKEGINIQDLSDYMMAKHVPEANKKGFEGSGKIASSGITDIKAEEILKGFGDSGKIDVLEKHSKIFKDIIQDYRNVLFESGLISQEQLNDFNSLYENYVPLQGVEEGQLGDLEDLFKQISESNSLSVKGKEYFNRKGRSSKADNVLVNIIQNYRKTLVRAEKNKLLKDASTLIEDNPELGVIVKQPKDFDPIKKLPENYVGFKKDGEQYYMSFENSRVAQALNQSGIKDLSNISKFSARINRYMSTMLTGRNIDFFLPNFVRDGQASILGLLDELDQNVDLKNIDREGLIKDVTKGVGNNLKKLFDSERDINNISDPYLKEYLEVGGKTNFNKAFSSQELTKKLKGFEKDFAKNKTLVFTKKAGENALNFLDSVASALENSYRFSTYKTLRERGVDALTAGTISKDLTVDFNQKGNKGTAVNAMYLFANAAIQSGVRAFKAQGKFKVNPETGKKTLSRTQKSVLAYAAMNGLLTWYNMSMTEEDEDGKTFYEKIPEYEKETNMIIVNPSNRKEYIKIPMPYIYNIAPNLARNSVEVFNGNKSIGEASGDWLLSIIQGASFINFFGNQSDPLKKVVDATPFTFKQPLSDLAFNENFFGGSIYNDPTFLQGKPRSYAGKKNTPEIYKIFAERVNDITGGDIDTKGKIDFPPEYIDYMVEFALGGVGKTFNNTYTSLETALDKDRKTPISKIPVVRRFYGEEPIFSNFKDYKERRDRLKDLERKFDRQFKNKTVNKKEFSKFLKVSRAFDFAKDRSSRYYEMKDLEMSKPKPNYKLVEGVENKILKEIKQANKIYNQTYGKNN